MTKAELVGKIATGGQITKSQAEKAIDRFVSVVSEALSQGDKITLIGFGTFTVGSRSQREGRNPRTGEKISIPVSKVVKFKASKSLARVLAVPPQGLPGSPGFGGRGALPGAPPSRDYPPLGRDRHPSRLGFGGGLEGDGDTDAPGGLEGDGGTDAP